MANNTQWNTLARALRELHRALVERARTDYLREHEIGGDIGPGELLRLLTTDPYFEWLRSLSELMVEIDLVHERAETPEELGEISVRGAVEYFVMPPESPEKASAFAKRYWPYVQDDPHVAMAHAAVKRALSAWPADDRLNRLEHRRQVAESAKR